MQVWTHRGSDRNRYGHIGVVGVQVWTYRGSWEHFYPKYCSSAKNTIPWKPIFQKFQFLYFAIPVKDMSIILVKTNEEIN